MDKEQLEARREELQAQREALIAQANEALAVLAGRIEEITWLIEQQDAPEKEAA